MSLQKATHSTTGTNRGVIVRRRGPRLRRRLTVFAMIAALLSTLFVAAAPTPASASNWRCSIRSINLVDLSNHRDIPGTWLRTGGTLNIDLATMPANFNIEVNARYRAESVQATVTGSGTHTENWAPYRFPSGDNTAWSPAPGTYSITAKSYTGNNATGTRCDTDTFTIVVSDSAIATPVLSGPSAPICADPADSDSATSLAPYVFLWENTIDVSNPQGQYGIPTADVRLKSFGTKTFSVALPPGFADRANVEISEAISWDGYLARPDAADQPNETFKVLLRNAGTVVFESGWTADLATGTLTDEWRGALSGGAFLANGADEMVIVHWSDAALGTGDGSSPNSVVPASICVQVEPVATDTDGDGVSDSLDNCVTVPNADQANFDGDAEGDLCDADDDNDGVDDGADNCPTASNSDQANLDGDDFGDACDSDRDGDGFEAAPSGADCDDLNGFINPSRPDVPNNGVDEDCTGGDLVAGCTFFGESVLTLLSQSDCTALEAMYTSIVGWDDPATNSDPCDLAAVLCVTTPFSSTVVNISAVGEGLTGTLPPEVGDFADLQTLNLSKGLTNPNQLTGSIPMEIGNLSNLRILNLEGNMLSGSLPAEIGNLGELRSLALQFNNLSGPLPASLGNLTKLRLLDIGANAFTGAPPAAFATLDSLVVFAAQNNGPGFNGDITAFVLGTMDTAVPNLSGNGCFFVTDPMAQNFMDTTAVPGWDAACP